MSNALPSLWGGVWDVEDWSSGYGTVDGSRRTSCEKTIFGEDGYRIDEKNSDVEKATEAESEHSEWAR
jgi:hypothetical protein